jgi:hypothetical protein
MMGHSGLEGIHGIPDLWGGALLGRTLRIAFWRLPASAVPTAREARIEWIYDQWDRLDGWLAKARALPPA